MPQHNSERRLASGNEAVAQAALDAGVALGTGYPGTPSTEILEAFDALGGRAQWAPNEKVALEVGIGAAFAGARALVTMKHVGLNVAADPLFTVAYTGVTGGLVVVSADDPGMASSQNEQDNRRFALAAGVPMLEPSDSQEAYDFTLLAIQISERWRIPVLLRMTTRVCHSATVVQTKGHFAPPAQPPTFVRDVPGRVMIPAYARPAHLRLRAKLTEIAAWNETDGPTQVVDGEDDLTWEPSKGSQTLPRWSAAGEGGGLPTRLGIITSGISYEHVREAAPGARVLKIGLSYPLPIEAMRRFAASVDRCLVVEEGDPYLYEAARTAGIAVEQKPEMYRFGELSVGRVRRIVAGDVSPEPALPAGKPPELCPGCPHRNVFEALRDLNCIVAGDIGCYTLGVLPPFSAMDTCVCMGAAIGVGLGLRHALPPEQARKVVSVIGDSTFVHSGITGLVEMVYNPPATGHVLVILDNGTTAMTGMQEHPGTGRRLDHEPTGRVVFEDLARTLGIKNVLTVDPIADSDAITRVLREALGRDELSVIIARRPCLLAAGAIKIREKKANAGR
jgi:indolepyruvate ferredoxin oxidoreductase alpha subunit